MGTQKQAENLRKKNKKTTEISLALHVGWDLHMFPTPRSCLLLMQERDGRA